MGNNKCEICSNPLSGKQSRFCSRKCANQTSNKKNQNYASQKKRGWERKLYVIDMMGGKCMRCGYNKNIAAMEFHHRDPTEKDTEIDMRKLSNSTMEWILNEASKCDLLCANCHREHHSPTCEMSHVRAKTGLPVLVKEKAVYECKCGTTIDRTANMCKTCADKKRRKVNRPPIEQLKEDLKTMSFVAVGKKYGVSDNAVRKWLK